MKKLNLIALFVLGIGISASYAQTNKELAKAKVNEAIKLEDEKEDFEGALKLLLEAEKLDPQDYTVRYELSYTYGHMEKYAKAADILEKLLADNKGTSQVYQSLGNNYDYLGMPDKAISVYEKGLTLYPKAGELYVELGNMALNAKNSDKALSYYEKGIQAEPDYAPNYFRAAKIYLTSSTEKVWGMMYGELFMNLDRTGKRVPEMGKLLCDTYKSQITFPAGSKASVSFTKNTVMTPQEITSGNLPFAMLYETSVAMGAARETQTDIASLDRIRTKALAQYLQLSAKAPGKSLLFDYQNKIKTAGHFEAYNNWLLCQGDFENFTKWKNANQTKWDAFLDWYLANPIKITEQNKFTRL